jgi:hypothetical protein
MQKYNCDSQKLQAAAGLLLRGEDNLIRHYRKTNRAIKDASIGTAPAYHTRRKDRVFYPTTDTYNNTYIIIEMDSLPLTTAARPKLLNT